MKKKEKTPARFEKVLFRTDDGSMDIDFDKVYGESIDRHGHSDNIRLRLPFGTTAGLQNLVEQCDQFRSYQDIIRTATVIYMKALAKKLKEETGFTDQTVFYAIMTAEGDRQDYIDDMEDESITKLENRLVVARERAKQERVVEVMTDATIMLDNDPTAPSFVMRLERIVEDASYWLADVRQK